MMNNLWFYKLKRQGIRVGDNQLLSSMIFVRNDYFLRADKYILLVNILFIN